MTRIWSGTSAAAPQVINYTVYGATGGDIPRPCQGDALVLTYSASDVLTGTEVSTFTVYDDDRLIQFDGQNGAPDSETGDAANGHFGYQGQEFSFNTTNAGAGDTQMVLVEVDYDGPGGAGTFEAIKYRYQLGGDYAVAYIPRLGSVDLADVGSVTGVTVLATSLDGALYTDFGLNFALTTVNGNAADDFLTGTWLHDKFNGKGGADGLLGSMGEDQLYGGGGSDHLFGGMHADTLDGGGGTDTLLGGSYDDSLIGGDGADDLFGGWGADTLDGNGGADIFVFGTDGDTDTVEDYRDGTDPAISSTAWPCSPRPS